MKSQIPWQWSRMSLAARETARRTSVARAAALAASLVAKPGMSKNQVRKKK